MQKEHRDFPCGARAVGEVGEEEAGPTSKEPLLSSLPSTVLPALQKAGTVCYAGAGMYRVFHMASVQSYTGRFIFILPSSAVASCCQSVTPAPICPPPTWALHPTMSQSFGSKLLWEDGVGCREHRGGEKLDSKRVKPPVPFLFHITQPCNSLQGHGPSNLGLMALWALEVDSPLLATLQALQKYS